MRVRDDLSELEGYHSPQVDVEVRLNTNESPLAPPAAWLEELTAELRHIDFNRYPDRDARELRAALGDLHGVSADEVFCGNGSNEVLQCLLLAYGGAGRRAAVFEPTYALHSHISNLTATEVVSAWRTPDHRIDLPRHRFRIQGSPEKFLHVFCNTLRIPQYLVMFKAKQSNVRSALDQGIYLI